MINDDIKMRDIHQVEYMFEIFTRSPHNRYVSDILFNQSTFTSSSLLRYNQFEVILQKWMMKTCNQLTRIATGEHKLSEDTFLSLSHLLHIIYNFLPTLDSCSWLTLQGAFTTTAMNLLKELNKPFGELTWYVWW